MKIVIKNCPAFVKSTKQCRGAYDNNIKHQYCSGNSETDCPIKQIVELCKKEKQKEETHRYKTNGYVLACNILNLLEIEEVNEE